MTQSQAKRLAVVKKEVIDLIVELEDAYENMSDAKQESDEGEMLQDNITNLTAASDALDEVAP